MGISVAQLLTGTIPEPTHTLNWGENIPSDIKRALDNGETAVLNDINGDPYSLVLKTILELYGSKEYDR